MDRRQRHTLSGICRNVRFDEDMGAHSTLRTGGRVGALVEVGSVQELQALLQWINVEGLPWAVIGGGSNILVREGHQSDVFLRLASGLGAIEQTEDSGEESAETCMLQVGCGCSLARLVKWCAGRGLSGLEWAVGIPGSVGGGIRMNAGAHGSDMGSVVSSITLMTAEGVSHMFRAEDLEFSYRSTIIRGFDPDRIVFTGAGFCFSYGQREKVYELMSTYRKHRGASQPAGASAGSFFKNPPGDAAGRLIEQAGLKGVCRGGARVSTVHANFIMNTGGATPGDVLALMDFVQQKVLQKYGILLEPEVHIL